MAQYDLYRWRTENDEEFPGDVKDSITKVGNTITLTLRWDADRSGATGTGCDPDNVNDMKCMSLEFEL